MSKLFVIDDSTPLHKLEHPEYRWDFGRGLDLSSRGPEGYAGVADPFPDELVIPQSEIQARIQERQDRKATLKENLLAAGVAVKNQERTNFCWVNAPTFATEVTRFRQGQRYVPLSPASAGAQITNYRNVGGWGKTALEWIVAHGVAPVDLWPANAISKQYATDATKKAALNYRVDEWWVLDTSNLDHLVSCLLRGVPVPIGLNWWSHEVTAVDVLWLDGEPAIQFANSWGDGWGDHGYGVLQGRKRNPDDAVAPRTAFAA